MILNSYERFHNQKSFSSGETMKNYDVFVNGKGGQVLCFTFHVSSFGRIEC